MIGTCFRVDEHTFHRVGMRLHDCWVLRGVLMGSGAALDGVESFYCELDGLCCLANDFLVSMSNYYYI